VEPEGGLEGRRYWNEQQNTTKIGRSMRRRNEGSAWGIGERGEGIWIWRRRIIIIRTMIKSRERGRLNNSDLYEAGRRER